MAWVLGGLPVHSLLVHFTVVAIPAAALAVVLSQFWPAARHRLGFITPLLALLALIAVPFTVNAGEWLYDRVEHTAAAQAHEAIGRSILPWVIVLFVVSVLQWAWYRWGAQLRAGTGFASRRGVQLAVAAVLTVAVLAGAVGSVVTVVIIGEAGTTAVWKDNFDG